MSPIGKIYPRSSENSRFSSSLGSDLSEKSEIPSNLFDDMNLEPEMPRGAHWSIAWSDLMMTMFILFLSMFVYQSAQQNFLSNKSPEIIGGRTTDALDVLDSTEIPSPTTAPANLPFITAGILPEITPIDAEFPEIHDSSQPPKATPPVNEAKKETPPLNLDSINDSQKTNAPSIDETKSPQHKDYDQLKAEDIALVLPNIPEIANTAVATNTSTATTPQHDATIYPRPITDNPPIVQQPIVTKQEPLIQVIPKQVPQFQEIYNQSKKNLESQNLEKFATVDLVPDKTMRIILTGDLLFGLGESSLTQKSLKDLKNITQIIRDTPYMVNVVGHTDNLPMSSERFPSNWELSVARASSVTRFLIQEMGMNPNQFVVSGYASYRPIKPNTNSANRATNRRVEIIISKRLPIPEPATPENLN